MTLNVGVKKRVRGGGRVSIPCNIRRKLDLSTADLLEVFTFDDGIILKKYRSSCVFCGGADNLLCYCGKHICSACVKKLSVYLS